MVINHQKIHIQIKPLAKRLAERCLICIACLLACMKGVYAYEFGVNSPYIKLRDSTLGELVLYVPQNMAEYLQISKTGQVISTYSGNITLYSNDSEHSYSISTYQNIRYRTNTTSTYQYISNAEILESNFLKLNGMFNSVNRDYALIGLLIIIAGGVMLTWWRR